MELLRIFTGLLMNGNDLFICESCGRVEPETCPKCPQVEKPTGVTVATIKERLEAADGITALETARKHYARHVATLRKKGCEAKEMAIQIDELVKYLRNGF
jgi:predicted ATP-dependent serine protease